MTNIKILELDIETSPCLAHVWGIWQQNVGLNQLLEVTEVLCWAAKWYGKPQILFSSIHGDGKETMLKIMWDLLDEADAVIHYNGQSFDIPHLNREFLVMGMAPPSPFKQIDLLKVVKSQFRFPSNKLDYVVRALGIGSKVKHAGHELWVKCMAGNDEAWINMETYNKMDVELLETLYNKLMPWVKGHPNLALYQEASDVLQCPRCGGEKYIKQGFAYTNVSKFQQYQCKDCNAWFRDRKNIADRTSVGANVT